MIQAIRAAKKGTKKAAPIKSKAGKPAATPKKTPAKKAQPSKESSSTNLLDGNAKEPDLLAKTWKPTERPIEEIIAERITIAPGDVGIKIAKDTPVEEHVALLDHFARRAECVQFWLGDLVAAGTTQHGATYEAACAITGYPISTLKTFASAARNIPLKIRQPTNLVPFTHQREVARLEDKDKAATILADAAEAAKKGQRKTVKEIRNAVTKAEPPKQSKPRKSGAVPGKKPKKVEPYAYMPDEVQLFNQVLDKAGELDTLLESPAGKAWISNTLKTENKLKKQLTAVLNSAAKFANMLDKHTGYGD